MEERPLSMGMPLNHIRTVTEAHTSAPGGAISKTEHLGNDNALLRSRRVGHISRSKHATAQHIPPCGYHMAITYYFNTSPRRFWNLAALCLLGWIAICFHKGLRHRDTYIAAAFFLFCLAVDGFTVEGRHW